MIKHIYRSARCKIELRRNIKFLIRERMRTDLAQRDDEDLRDCNKRWMAACEIRRI